MAYPPQPPKPVLRPRPNGRSVPRRGLALSLLRVTLPTTLPRPRGSLRRSKPVETHASRVAIGATHSTA